MATVNITSDRKIYWPVGSDGPFYNISVREDDTGLTIRSSTSNILTILMGDVVKFDGTGDTILTRQNKAALADRIRGIFFLNRSTGGTSTDLSSYSTTAQMNAAMSAISLTPGPQGATGQTGSQGVQGVPGPQGIAGTAGSKGDKGDKGDVGAQGPGGTTGATGAQGPIGLTGATGAAGSNASVTSANVQAAVGYSIVYLSNVTISETAVLAISAGVRKVTITGVTGIVAGDRVVLTPVSATPAGYALADVVATAANTLQVTLTVPLIALGASYSIVCKTTVFR